MKTDTGQGNGRRLRRVALWTTAGLFIVAVLAVTWLMTADLGFVRPKIERTLTELTGRQFELRGGLEVDIGRQIVVVARDIRWQNADWDEPAEMLSVGYAEIHVDLWSLLNGPIEVEYVEVSDADVVVTQREDGRLNWDVFDTEPSEATGEAEEQGKGFLLRQVDVDDVRVVYTSPDRERPVRLHVAKLDQRHREDDFLDLNLDGTLGERAINLTGESGPWSALQSGRDIRFDLKGVFGSLEWAADGQIDDVASPGKPEINVVAKAPSVDDIARMLGLADGGTGEIDIVAALAASEDGPLVLDVLASVGETELEAEGVVSDLGDLERVDLDLRASGPNLGGVLRFFGVDDVADGPFSINVDAKRDGELVDVQQARMMFGETQFLMNARLPAFPSLDDGSIDLNASGPDVEHFRSLFGLPGAATGPFSIDLDLTVLPDGIEAVRLVAETSLGRLAANGTLGDAPQYLGSRF
ncbi:MAG: AsmA family protein, partial [Pseudomonadota bacterium]